MTHRAAWRLSAFVLLVALLLAPGLALAAPPAGNPCRRIEAAGEVNRRCERAAADDHIAACRRLEAAGEANRRCDRADPNADLVHVCRRIVNAGQWTRRCLPVYPGGPGAQ